MMKIFHAQNSNYGHKLTVLDQQGHNVNPARTWVLSDPSTPTKILEEAYLQRKDSIRSIIKHPFCPPHILEDAICMVSEDLAVSVSSHPQLTVEMADNLVKMWSTHVSIRFNCITSPAATTELIEQVLREEQKRVPTSMLIQGVFLQNIFLHKNAPHHILLELRLVENRGSVAANIFENLTTEQKKKAYIKHLQLEKMQGEVLLPLEWYEQLEKSMR